MYKHPANITTRTRLGIYSPPILFCYWLANEGSTRARQQERELHTRVVAPIEGPNTPWNTNSRERSFPLSLTHTLSLATCRQNKRTWPPRRARTSSSSIVARLGSWNKKFPHARANRNIHAMRSPMFVIQGVPREANHARRTHREKCFKWNLHCFEGDIFMVTTNLATLSFYF